MSDSTANVTIKIGATGDFAAFAAAKAHAEMLRTSIEGVKHTLEAFGLGFGVSQLVEFGRSVVELGSSLERLSAQAHISTSAFQTLSMVAMEAGLKEDELAQKLEYLNKSMGLAAQGSAKQNAAIADLGLNTAELLAMPVEQQLEAIARAYESSSDKGAAYADIVSLLGRGTAQLQQVLEKLATDGFVNLDAQNAAWKVSDADLKKIDEAEIKLKRLWRMVEIAAARTVTGGIHDWVRQSVYGADDQRKDGGGTNTDWTGGAGTYKSIVPSSKPPQEQVDKINKQIADQIAALPAMITAHQALTKALRDEVGAYEDLDQKAARLRSEAADDDAKAKAAASANKYDATAQIEAIHLETEASKLRGAANKAEAEADKKYIQDTIKESHRDYAAERKLGEQKVQNIEAEMHAQERLNAVAIASIEHDRTQTDNEKWRQKKDILEANVAELSAYIAKLDAIASNPLNPTEVNDKAAGASQRAAGSVAGSKGQLADMDVDPKSFTKNFSADITQLEKQWGTFQQNMASGLTNVIGSSLQSVEGNMSRLITGTETWRQALTGIVQTIEGSLVASFVKMGVEWVTTHIMMAVEGKAIAAGSVAATVPLAAAESAIWASPAALATIASWGGAAAAAPGMVLASIAATRAMSVAGGFEEGGYTGGQEGQFAGIVHGGEYVFSAPAVRSLGIENLDRAHQMAKVGETAQAPAQAAGSGGMPHLHFHNNYDEAFRAAYRNPANQRFLVDQHRRFARSV